MFLKVKLVNDTGLVGKNPETGKCYIINTGVSFTGVTEDGKKCSIINTNRVASLKHFGGKMIVVHENHVFDNHDLLIEPDDQWILTPIE